MPNYLHPIERNYANARKELERAIEVLETAEGGAEKAVQSLVVDDQMAELLKEKPVILIQYMNVKIIRINNHIQKALRLYDRAELYRQRELLLRKNGCVKTRREDEDASGV